MAGDNHHAPGLSGLLGRVARTGWGALQNRAELFAVEWQEERVRMAQTMMWTVGLLFLGVMFALLLTGVIIFLFPEDLRLYAAGGFAVLYLAGAVSAAFGLKAVLKREPFSESLGQLKKDRLLIEGLE